MAITGIICEFNPLHNGHKYLIEQAKGTVVCVMSGNSTQRGELAVADKYARAEAALRCGADLVLELPYPWCSGSAEYFSRAAVGILESLETDNLLFGSESGDVEALKRAAECALSDEFAQRYESACNANVPSTAAYLNTLNDLCSFEAGSNDILGIEYIKAIISSNGKMKPTAVKRKGAAYLCDKLTEGEIASATALRQARSFEDIAQYMPKGSFDILRREADEENFPCDMKNIESAVLSFFRLHPPSFFTDANIAGAGGGVANLLCRAAAESRTLDEMLQKAVTKNYTNSRIRRTLLYCMTGVEYADLENMPSYVNLLATNKCGRELLGRVRYAENTGLQILTKPSDCVQINSDNARRQAELSKRLDSIYTLASPKPKIAGDMLRRSPYIEN